MREIVIATWAIIMTAWSIVCHRRFRAADREATQLDAKLAAIGRERLEQHKRRSEAAVRGAMTRREFARQAKVLAEFSRDSSVVAHTDITICREQGCGRPATHWRPGFGENFRHCEEHDKINADAIKNADCLTL